MRSQRAESREQRSVGGTRETVETVPPSGAADCTSLKRGVNERLAFTHPSAGTRPAAQGALPRLAFTLIELLIVIAIMAILAALIIPITSAVTAAKLRNRTKTELKQVESAIQNYKTKKGYYPPDNPNVAAPLNQLYYELSGTVFSNGVYTTLDGNAIVTPAQLPVGFGAASKINGFINTTKGAGDEGMMAKNFIPNLKPTQVATMQTGINVLVGSVGWDPGVPAPPLQPPLGKLGANPFRYVSTNPTNNPNSFDLWIDILVRGKTNRICNWSEDPIVGYFN